MGAGVCTRTTAMSKAMSEATTQGENMSLGEKALFAFDPLINDTPMVNTSKLNGMLSTEAQNTAFEPNTASHTG